MLHRFFDAIREIGRDSGFEAYCTDLQRSGFAGAPTVSEARREYQAVVQRSSIVLLF